MAGKAMPVSVGVACSSSPVSSSSPAPGSASAAHWRQAQQYEADAKRDDAASCLSRHTEARREALAEQFGNAAKAYRMAQCWGDAARCFRLAADTAPPGLTVKWYVLECAQCHRKNGDVHEALAAYQRYASLLDNHRDLGKTYEQMGALCQEELLPAERALQYYAQAVSSYRAADAHASANRAQMRLADLRLEQQQWPEAQRDLEEWCQQTVTSLPWGVPDALTKAVLCKINTDPSGDHAALLEAYADAYPLFQCSTQYVFLQLLLAVCATGNLDEFDALLGRHAHLIRTPPLVRLLHSLKTRLSEVDLR